MKLIQLYFRSWFKRVSLSNKESFSYLFVEPTGSLKDGRLNKAPPNLETLQAVSLYKLPFIIPGHLFDPCLEGKPAQFQFVYS